MSNNTDQNFEKLSLDFLICCYFGQSENLGKAAIDRAYVDMAAHTIDIPDLTAKWKMRYEASCTISKRLTAYKPRDKFDEWHRKTITEMKRLYNGNLTDGQAQKWLNMTIKYLFVFNSLLSLLGTPDKRLSSFHNFLTSTDASEYKVPIDGFVLKGLKIKSSCWSKLEEKEYANVEQQLVYEDKDFDFFSELEKWEEFSRLKKPDKGTYARYIEDEGYESY